MPLKPLEVQENVAESGPSSTLKVSALLALVSVFAFAAAAYFPLANHLSLGHDIGVAAAVLLIGLMRYVFVVAQVPVPLLAGRLQPSLRRKIVCVVQVAVLCIILVPFVTAPVSSWLAALALVLLSYSFAVDCIYLLSEAGGDEQ